MTAQLDGVDGGIEYSTHVENKGWLGKVNNGQVSGTTGEHLHLEALNCNLTGNAAQNYDVYYRTHVQDYGWLGWAKNGENAGTAGGNKQLEALQIVLVPKNGAAPGDTSNAFKELTMSQPSQPTGPSTSNGSITSYVPGNRDVENFLRTAIQPVGNTMYIWGGGWNEPDNAAGPGALTIGVLPQWKAFFDQQNSSYNYLNYKYQILNGLDCSGYVGWTVYNTLNTVNNGHGEVYWADDQAYWYAQKGYGTYTPYGSVRSFEPGDIISMNEDGHVYIVIGRCADGSVVIAHASPPGVMLSGILNPDGSQSQATQLARAYMQKYYPEYYARYSNKIDRGYFYMSRCSKFRWGDNFVADLTGIRSLNANQVLAKLFNE